MGPKNLKFSAQMHTPKRGHTRSGQAWRAGASRAERPRAIIATSSRHLRAIIVQTPAHCRARTEQVPPQLQRASARMQIQMQMEGKNKGKP